LSSKVYPTVTVKDVSGSISSRKTHQVQLTDRFEHNEAGQLIRYIDPSGARIEYFYHPEGNPTGDKSVNSLESLVQSAGGYLARVVRDPASADRPLDDPPANIVTGFGYDDFGNLPSFKMVRATPRAWNTMPNIT
jgi:YD repeat-containing protein